MRRGEPELRLIPFLADKQRVSIDIGAHKGLYSYAMLRHSTAVHAFEPNPEMYAMLRERVHGLAGKITTHPTALSNVTGTAELRIPLRGTRNDHPSASLSSTAVAGEHVATRVSTTRFDDLDITNVGLMKIDVVGFEQEVLAGAAETIRRDRPNLLIELEERHTGVPIEHMVASVCALGYECVALRHGVLVSFGALDLARHHRERKSKAEYVNNFVFLPRIGAGTSGP
jgi:FkbM family methyltransferase